MEEILKLLNDTEIIEDYEVLSYVQDEDFYYLKIKSQIVNGGFLFIKLYLSSTEYNYSFHWQEADGRLIVRWDNAPHHSQIETYPHHMHIEEDIKESYSITINDVLKEIKSHQKQSKTSLDL